MTQKESFEFGVEAKKILKLMIHSLYTNKDVALRELISNASDACDKLRYKALQDDSLLGDDRELKILIEVDEEKKTLSIIDNGIGMERGELISQLGTIAKSGTEAFLKNLTDDDSRNMQLIGQFGVGFYSSFMIADRVSVMSRKAGRKKTHMWESKGDGKYTITEIAGEQPRGTRITLYLKEGEDNFLNKMHIQNIVRIYSDHIDFPIEMRFEGDKPKVLNSGSALWTRQKNEITEEQYRDFYTHISHLPGEPFMVMHNRAEGLVEFTNLLFIPNSKPFDLYNPDRISRVKLYVKKIFITEDAVELLPKYLRFVQGVVDSQDLPLNISRETLQYNSVVEKIKRSLTKRILGELDKKANKEPEKYQDFWNNFGPVIKEGLCEGSSAHDDILQICRFHTSKSVDKAISLNEYIDRMPPTQDTIYYIIGDSVAKVDGNPQLEGFKSRGIEVLYLTDTVDNFWVTVVAGYRGKKIKSITRVDVDLDEAKPSEDESDDPIKFDDEKKKAKDVTESKYEAMLDLMRNTLEGKVKDVKLTKKLTNSPVCLVSDLGSMDIRLERYLVEQRQISKAMLKIMEINPDHPIVLHINKNIDRIEKRDELRSRIKLLYDQACILEGEPVDNPAEFASRINELMMK